MGKMVGLQVRKFRYIPHGRLTEPK